MSFQEAKFLFSSASGLPSQSYKHGSSGGGGKRDQTGSNIFTCSAHIVNWSILLFKLTCSFYLYSDYSTQTTALSIVYCTSQCNEVP